MLTIYQPASRKISIVITFENSDERTLEPRFMDMSGVLKLKKCIKRVKYVHTLSLGFDEGI